MIDAYVVAGLGFGDEGKGTMTDYLVRAHDAELVVRYNGGCQAAHNVVTPEGLHHTFCQFGSGTFHPGTRTHLSRFVLVDPLRLIEEARVLKGKGIQSPLSLLSIDPEAAIVTPFHALLGQMKEVLRGAAAHGSVGVGIGETRSDQIKFRNTNQKFTFSDLSYSRDSIDQALLDIKSRKRQEAFEVRKNNKFSDTSSHIKYKSEELYEKMLRIDCNELAYDYSRFALKVHCRALIDTLPKTRPIVFEGAQGVLLDETYGFAPFNTWTDITFNNSTSLISECRSIREPKNIGVVRSYATRHGAGPFPTEDPDIKVPEPHNCPHTWMGNFRQGYFDYALMNYALNCVETCHSIAITHMDVRPSKLVATQHISDDGTNFPTFTSQAQTVLFLSSCETQYVSVDDLPGFIEYNSGIPVQYLSNGPTFKDKIEIVAK